MRLFFNFFPSKGAEQNNITTSTTVEWTMTLKKEKEKERKISWIREIFENDRLKEIDGKNYFDNVLLCRN